MNEPLPLFNVETSGFIVVELLEPVKSVKSSNLSLSVQFILFYFYAQLFSLASLLYALGDEFEVGGAR